MPPAAPQKLQNVERYDAYDRTGWGTFVTNKLGSCSSNATHSSHGRSRKAASSHAEASRSRDVHFAPLTGGSFCEVEQSVEHAQARFATHFTSQLRAQLFRLFIIGFSVRAAKTINRPPAAGLIVWHGAASASLASGAIWY